MFGFAFGEFAFGELPAAPSPVLTLLRDPRARRVYLVEIYPYEF